MPLISFDTPRKHEKISGILKFSGGIKRDQWNEMGQNWKALQPIACRLREFAEGVLQVVLFRVLYFK